MVLAGFLLALWYTQTQVKASLKGKTIEPGDITPEHVFDMCLAALFAGIVGARILYIALDYNEFSGRPLDFFKVWTGGISIHGAVVASTLYCWFYSKKHKLNFAKFADICAPGLALGYAIGRIGCLLNGCCYGAACSLPWAMRFLKDGTPGVYTEPSHPTQLYATILHLFLFGMLHLFNKRPHKNGETLYFFFTGYLLFRFLDEIYRKGATADIFMWGMTHAQVFSLVALPVVIILWLRLRSRKEGIAAA